MRGQATDETGAVVDLTTAQALTMLAVMSTHTITGPAVAITPPIADPDGIHHWNWQYNFSVGDTAQAGNYDVYLQVTWAANEIEYFPDSGSEQLTIEALT